MGKHAGRKTSLGVAVAVPVLSAAFAFPGTAVADPSPTLDGDCAATLQNGKDGKDGKGLTLDAGAPLNAPDRVTVGLDSKSEQADGKNPLLTVPVGDLARGLGVGEVPVVGDAAADGVCPVAKDVANGVGNTTQQLVGGVQGTPPGDGPGEDPGPGPGPGTEPTPPGGSTPAPGGTLDPVKTGGPDDLTSISGIFTGAAMLPASFVQAPVVTQVIPGQLPQNPVPPTVDEKKSGSAQALPAATPPARLPLLLAVLALAIVAAALVRAWLRRKPA
ncbi:hypothetical protein [Amycolatopsis jiangsuensis]|uniref:Uncharacterized protein n=1 Tax=Amycolatopsis jiangsuensis TaxID=1181879 RepID=A0A840IWY7_9PSEU|nr:hypothetical protein [Amycolatopsis jiangsuensis]MBB4687301.1 hypothetical protein [Amycolatopsis jiangsuensis]